MNNAFNWYSQLVKPSWAPGANVFGPVWTVLYVLIAISFGIVFMLAYKKEIPFKVILPFIANLFFNFIFTFIQFQLRNNILATVDVILVLGTLVFAMMDIYPYKKWIAYFQIPYLGWVLFATILQLTIAYLNF